MIKQTRTLATKLTRFQPLSKLGKSNSMTKAARIEKSRSGDGPRISIVTPSLNQGEFIEENILSVRHQDFPEFEHLVIDGGSTDATLEVLRKYPHLTVVSEKDRGQADALNKGFRLARGAWIGWLNADDFYLPGALRALAGVVGRPDPPDAVYGDYFVVDRESRVTKVHRTLACDRRMLTYLGAYLPTSGSLFSRKIVEEGLFLDPEYRYSLDGEFYCRLLERKKRIARIPRFLNCFRQHPEAQSARVLFTRDPAARRKIADEMRAEREKTRKRYGLKIFPGDRANAGVHRVLSRYYQFSYLARQVRNGHYRLRWEAGRGWELYGMNLSPRDRRGWEKSLPFIRKFSRAEETAGGA